VARCFSKEKGFLSHKISVKKGRFRVAFGKYNINPKIVVNNNQLLAKIIVDNDNQSLTRIINVGKLLLIQSLQIIFMICKI